MRTTWQYFDFLLLGAVAILTIFGIAMIRSAVGENVELAGAPQRQLIFAVLGFVFVFLTASIDYHTWSSVSGTLYVGMVGMLIALNVIAQAVFGSARWFKTALVNIQPSELAKVIIILVLADFFTRHKHRMVDFRWVLRSLLLALGIVIWVVLQPNLSTSILLMVLWFVLWWASGARMRHMLYFVAGGVLFLAIAIPSLPTLQKIGLIKEYQVKRINNFLKPTGGETAARYGDQYNIEQALIAIGDGGLTGRGLGQGSQVQMRYLKVRWSDFIFAAMAEEFGFIGVGLFMILVAFVVLRCLRAARIARDTYGGLICYGVATLIGFQAMVNMGVNLKLLPATGLPLPFISYGGSSLFTLLLGIGLVESVVVRHKILEF
jgi:rod shape determining protein RodA